MYKISPKLFSVSLSIALTCRNKKRLWLSTDDDDDDDDDDELKAYK